MPIEGSIIARIAYLITRLDSVGGAQVHIRDLATHLLGKGHEVHVIGGGNGTYIESLEARGITVHRLERLGRPLNPQADIAALQELRQLLGRVRPQLISTHSSKAGLIGRLAGRTLGIPTLFTAHGWAFTDGVSPREARFYRWAERTAAPLGPKIITVSEFDRKIALEHHIAPAGKLVAVHNGMPEIAREYWAKPEQHTKNLVMVARFQEQKDHHTLFRALAALKNEDWKLDLIGDGPLEAEARRQVAQLGLSEKIRFLGACSDVAKRLSKAQIFLLISHWEGFPRSILEAMRAGLPVVASDVGGVREAVSEGKTGFLIPRQDAALLSSILRELLHRPELRSQLGQRGRVVFSANFTFEHMLTKTLAVYDEVLSTQGSRVGPESDSTLRNSLGP